MTTILIILMMSGMAVAEGDRMYGMMSSECPECVDCVGVTDAMENLPFAQFDAMSAEVTATSSGITIEEEWAYGRRNVAPEGVEHVYWDFEEGGNLYPFKNAHPEVAVFENVSNSRCCYPACDDNNEPSYVRQGANCGPRCQCIMYIYPTPRTFTNGTDIPYIHIVNGRAAFAPRVEVGGMRCFYPACSAFIGFKDDTNFVSFLVSTNSNLYVRMYDKRDNYLGGKTVYCNTDRVGNGSSNFTRHTAHMDSEIRYMTFSGPFNGWHIDDLIVGGEPGYLNKPVNYTYVARRAQELHGVDYLEYGLGHDYVIMDYMDPLQFTDGMMGEYWNPETKMFEEGEGISNAGLILWAYNYDADDLAGTSFVKRNTVAGMEKHDFTVDVDPASTQPGDVCFMDRKDRNGDYGSDGYADEVYMVIETTEYGSDLITSCPNDNTGVIYSKKSNVEDLSTFMGYKRLPGVIRGGKNPVPKGH